VARWVRFFLTRFRKILTMLAPIPLLVLTLTAQVPPPDAAVKVAESLRSEERAILDREAGRLKALADRLAAGGDAEAARQVRSFLPPPPEPDGALRFVPLPEVVPGRGRGLPNVPAGPRPAPPWRAEADAARAEAAGALLALANRAAEAVPRHYALADACLRAVIARQPDHPEARRLLGFVPYEGGWATPYAAQQFRDGKTFHRVYSWVKADWVPHLERGELPAQGRPGRREVWLPAAEADAQRANFRPGWTIQTEHFAIKTNVPLSEAIAFGRHLETLHELFQSLLADVIGENLPLAQRFKNKALAGERSAAPHLVSYFAEKSQFVDHLRPAQGDEIEQSLGLYLPASKGSRRGQAYFYRDRGGEIQDTATLYHEVSHQLLFESGVAGPNDYTRNVGNFWVFEGLGTYFETLSVPSEGVVHIGGLSGPRNAEARKTFSQPGKLVPLAALVRMSKDTFNGNRGGNVYEHYQEAIALTCFLMNGRGGAYREGFLDYVKDACRGLIRRTAGRSLEDRLGKPYDQIQAEFLEYLKNGGAP
jgi:hypothetical protein